MIIRKAVVADVPEIRKLIEPFVKDRLLLPKSLHSLYSSLRDFWILTDDAGRFIGCSASGLRHATIRPIQTRFPSRLRHSYALTSLHIVTRRLILQKARGHPLTLAGP